MIFKHKLFKKEYIFFLFFSFFVLVIANNLVIPPDSHYYVANINFAPDSISKSIYELIRSPIYYLYESSYNSYSLYFLLSFIHLALFFIVLFELLVKLNNSIFSSILILILLSPLSFRLLNAVSNYESLIFLESFFSSLSRFSPTHFGWASQGFTPRILSGILLIIIFYSLLTKKYFRAGILMSIIFLCHPNNAIAILAWFILFLIVKFIYKKVHIKQISTFIMLSFIGFIFAFILLNIKGQNIVGSGNYYSIDWYLNSYHINAINFSGVYYLFNETLITSFRIIFILIISFFSFKFLDIKYNLDLFILALVPVFLFFITLSLELLIANGLVQINLLNRFIVSGQFGLKILDLSFFPIIIFLSLWIKKVIKFLNFDQKLKYILNSVILVCLVLLLFSNNFRSNFEAFNQKYDYEYSLKKISEIKLNPMLLPIRNKSNKPDLNYLSDFSDFDNILEIKNRISTLVPKGSLIIVPPYQDKFRDLFIDYEIYYQDVPDASLFLGGGNSSKIMKDRFELLFNKKFTSFNSNHSGLYWTDLRNEFLSINEKDFFNLKRKISKDKIYLITESKINYDLKLLLSNDSYNLFEI